MARTFIGTSISAAAASAVTDSKCTVTSLAVTVTKCCQQEAVRGISHMKCGSAKKLCVPHRSFFIGY